MALSRNMLGFWLLGIFNNYSYVIMLSAAHDLLKADNNDIDIDTDGDNGRDCNQMSTGTILLADVLPAIIIKSIAPFFRININIKVTVVVLLSSISFIIVSASGSDPTVTILGVVCASISSGLGEATFLAHTTNFPSSSSSAISAWSSGTGFSGVVGAGSYALLTSLGVRPHTSVLIMLFVPVGLALSFWCLLEPEFESSVDTVYTPLPDHDDRDNQENEIEQESSSTLTIREKFLLIKSLRRFMLPLGAVYFFEYLINQGVFELLYFPNTFMSHSQQYRWYQLVYQLGVLISRSSLSCVTIRKIFLLSLFQGANLIILTSQAVFWSLSGNGGLVVIFCFIFWEGLLGGAAYVNTFNNISQESQKRNREFSLGIASVADSLAIALAGFTALPLHNWICNMPI